MNRPGSDAEELPSIKREQGTARTSISRRCTCLLPGGVHRSEDGRRSVIYEYAARGIIEGWKHRLNRFTAEDFYVVKVDYQIGTPPIEVAAAPSRIKGNLADGLIAEGIVWFHGIVEGMARS